MTDPELAHKVTRRQVIRTMAAGAGASLVPATLFVPSDASASIEFDDGLPRMPPDRAGVNARTVLDFIDSAFAVPLDLYSFMLYRQGSVVAEAWSWPYAKQRPHMMHSLTKSVTACAVGIAIDEGYFSLNDKVVSFFNEELPAVVNTKLEAMTIRDLLTMQSGHAKSVSGSVFRQIETSWIEEFFRIPVEYDPGTHFVYSSASSFMLSAIVTRTTGETLQNFLGRRMFRPLGISNLTWGSSPGGINSGGNGLSWTTADSLKLGILHLQQGEWNGRRILPEKWVAEATRTQVPGEYYGYHWWQNEMGNAYLADGAFGQFSIVFPEYDAVLAVTAGVHDDRLIELVWEHFPKAFHDSKAGLNKTSNAELKYRTENLRLLPEARFSTSPLASLITKKIYSIEANEDLVSEIRLTFSDDELLFWLSDHRGEHKVIVGMRQWIESTTSVTGNKLHHQYQSDDMRVVAHGRWWDAHTLEMTWQFVETAWVDTVVCRFYDDRISFDRRTNANYAPRVRPTLRGRYT